LREHVPPATGDFNGRKMRKILPSAAAIAGAGRAIGGPKSQRSKVFFTLARRLLSNG